MECELEKRDGSATVWTWSGPNASAAIVATIAESIPPESPITTSVKLFFLR